MSDRTLRQLALAALVVFLGCVLAEHVLSPELDPARHEISEYVYTSSGWLMTLGFVAWAASLAASSVYAWRSLHARAVPALLLLAALGLVLAACFATQTSAGSLPPGVSLDATGRMHDVGSGLTSLALLAAAVVSLFYRRPGGIFFKVTAVVVASAIVCDLALLAIGPSVGGVRQRLLVLAACVWQFALITALASYQYSALRQTGRLSASKAGRFEDA